MRRNCPDARAAAERFQIQRLSMRNLSPNPCAAESASHGERLRLKSSKSVLEGGSRMFEQFEVVSEPTHRRDGRTIQKGAKE